MWDEAFGGGKFASPHELMRAFGIRWAMMFPSITLKNLKRHSSIATTEEYYTITNLDVLGSTVWERFESANTPTEAVQVWSCGATRKAHSLKSQEVGFFSGERGIRTPGPVSRTQHFQCCTIGHSAISPFDTQPQPPPRLAGV